MATTEKQVTEDVKEYYGKTLETSKDLKSDMSDMTCIMGRAKIPKKIRKALAAVHPEVSGRFYGCGLTIPTLVEGGRVVDLGSGSGQDCFAISKLVGPNGYVVGVDMTDEMLAIAHQYEDYHRDTFGYKEKNTQFVKGYIEDLKAAGLKDGDFDIVVSNCVVNLSPDKRAVLKEAYRVLKPGGELYFSDIYTENDLPEQVKKDKVLWGECLAGALTWKDLISFSKDCGFSTPRLVSAHAVKITDKQAASVIGEIRFVSAVYRMFKLPMKAATLEKASNITYTGSIEEYEEELPFDSDLSFKTGISVETDAELTAIIKSSRYANVFQISPTSKTEADSSNASKCPTNPFKLLEKQAKDGDNPSTATKGSCCS